MILILQFGECDRYFVVEGDSANDVRSGSIKDFKVLKADYGK